MVQQSVENSPIALAIAQLVILIINAVLYSRQKSALDVEKRDRGQFGPQVQQALSVAEAAKHEIGKLEVEHYKRLAALVSALTAEHEACKQKVLALEESVASLSNKLASRDRADAAAAKRKAAAAMPAEEGAPQLPMFHGPQAGQPGVLDAATLAQLGAIPLSQPSAAPAAPRDPTFGKVAR